MVDLFINTTQISNIIKVRNNVYRVEYEVITGKTVRREYELSVLAQSTISTLLIQKTYQFINVVNGVSHSHKTANISFSFDSVA